MGAVCTEGCHREDASTVGKISGSKIGGDSNQTATDTVSNYWPASTSGQNTPLL
jgi:hypothetical protein